MNFSIIFYIIGYVLKIEGLLMLLPTAVGFYYGEAQAKSFLLCALFTAALGFFITVKKPKNQIFYAKEGFVSVALSWLILSLFGCLPFVMNGDIPRFIDAFFETVSGFTTTGSSILSDVEALARCSLFWRSFTHWIGGMGILVFLLCLLPITGGATMHLMRAESPGPQVGKMVPKARNTAIILYVIYTLMTVAEIILLLIAGMPFFDAVTLSFGSAGTGGFSILNSGLATYNPASQYIVAIFMILFGVNFNVYFLIWRHPRQAARCEEARWYIAFIALATLAVTVNIRHLFPNLEETFRHALFQVGSIITTTGFTTTDFDLWPTLSKMILVLLMFIGACAGSTGGGIKVSRVLIYAKLWFAELGRIVHPRAVKKIRLEGKVVEHHTLRSANTFLAAYIAIFVVSVLIISADSNSFTTAFTGVAATMNNIGPGLDAVGPTRNFGAFSDFSKVIFSLDMLAGRLELFPLLVLFNPKTWNRAFLKK